MSDTLVTVLTPPGTGAIATVEVRGPRAWELARALFKPAGKPLPEAPDVDRFWFGTLGADEVVLAITAPDAVEVHCHGGRRVVRWVVEQFLTSGAREAGGTGLPPCATSGDPSGVQNPELTTPRDPDFPAPEGPAGVAQGGSPVPPSCDQPTGSPLPFAPTLRTASIILDQLNGAFAAEVRRVLALLETDPRAAAFPLHRLAELGDTVGRHLIEPWKVVIAGAPNVGKSSLINALAGYQRAVVSDVAGTTRDTVSVRTAFDGWPVELIDTAGIRDAEGLEAEGIARAKRALDEADLVVWVLDGAALRLEWPGAGRLHVVINKSDALVNRNDIARTLPLVSARTGEGVQNLANDLVTKLVPQPPAAGAAVPYTPQLVDLVRTAAERTAGGAWDAAAALLREALAQAESSSFKFVGCAPPAC